MKLTQLWKKFCGRPGDEPFDPRRDLFRPRLNRLENCEFKPGLYHCLREVEGANTRFHLRVDSNGSGVLLANASSAARLRHSGTIIAKAILDGDDDAAIVAKLQKSFHGVSDRQANDDINRVRSIIRSLEAPGDNYPILNLGDPSFGPDVVPLKKPLSADVPLAAPEQLVPILDRLWQEGIPHVTLIASTGFDRAALVRAVERAEDLGMIAGVRVRASEVDDEAFITELAQAGVDHINVLYLSSDHQVHDAIAGAGDQVAAVRVLEQVRSNEVCPVAEVGLVEPTLDTLEETIEGLTEAGVTNVAFFPLATEDTRPVGEALTARQLIQAADLIEEFSEAMRVRYLWYPPVQAAGNIPLHEQVCQGPRTSGDHAIRVQTDGAVFVARGPWQAIGNICQDAWESIARSEVYEAYWQRVHTDTHCQECPGLVICASDCPRTAAGWAGSRERTA